MKRASIVLLALFMTFTVFAISNQGEPVTHQLIVWLKDGSKMTYDFASKPVVSMADDLFVCGSTNLDFLLFDSVQKFTVREVTESSSATTIEGKKEPLPRVTESSDGILLSGCTPDSELSVYSYNGILVSKDKVHADGTLCISMEGWSAGVYIVKSSNINLKILRK